MNWLFQKASLAAVVLAGLLAARAVMAAEAPVWSLAEVKRLAAERNWDVLAARSGVDVAEAQWLVAKEFPNPNLSASSAKIGAHASGTPAGNGVWARSYDTIFAVNQLFEVAGKRRDRQSAARQNVLGSKARFLDAERTLDQGVTKAYVAALLAGENARILHESAGYMRQEEEIAEARFKAGDLAESDFRQIQVAVGQYVLQETAADAAAVQARTAVEILVGVAASKGDWRPTDSLEQISAAGPTKSLPGAGRVRPDVLAAQTDVRAAQSNLALQKAYRIPDPTISLQYEHNPPGGGPPVDTVGLGVSIPLPIWNQNRGAISAAQAAVEQARLALEKASAQAAADLVNAQVAFDEAAARGKRYREEIQPRSAAAREAVIFKFNKGGATLVDLLEAERTDNDVRLATAQAMADTAAAGADLTAAQSALTESELSAVK